MIVYLPYLIDKMKAYKMPEIELGATLPSKFKSFLKQLKKTAADGEPYYVERWYTPKVVTLVFYDGIVFGATPTVSETLDIRKTYRGNKPIYMSISLTDLVGSHKYPGLLDVIREDRLDLYGIDDFFVIKQGRDTFRMAVL